MDEDGGAALGALGLGGGDGALGVEDAQVVREPLGVEVFGEGEGRARGGHGLVQRGEAVLLAGVGDQGGSFIARVEGVTDLRPGSPAAIPVYMPHAHLFDAGGVLVA